MHKGDRRYSRYNQGLTPLDRNLLANVDFCDAVHSFVQKGDVFAEMAKYKTSFHRRMVHEKENTTLLKTRFRTLSSNLSEFKSELDTHINGVDDSVKQCEQDIRDLRKRVRELDEQLLGLVFDCAVSGARPSGAMKTLALLLGPGVVSRISLSSTRSKILNTQLEPKFVGILGERAVFQAEIKAKGAEIRDGKRAQKIIHGAKTPISVINTFSLAISGVWSSIASDIDTLLDKEDYLVESPSMFDSRLTRTCSMYQHVKIVLESYKNAIVLLQVSEPVQKKKYSLTQSLRDLWSGKVRDSDATSDYESDIYVDLEAY